MSATVGRTNFTRRRVSEVWTEGEAVKEHDLLSTASLNRYQLHNRRRQKSSVTEKGVGWVMRNCCRRLSLLTFQPNAPVVFQSQKILSFTRLTWHIPLQAQLFNNDNPFTLETNLTHGFVHYTTGGMSCTRSTEQKVTLLRVLNWCLYITWPLPNQTRTPPCREQCL